MDDTRADDQSVPEWSRPLETQISTVRHDVAGIRTALQLLHDSVVRLSAQVATNETRQNLMDAKLAQMALTPEAISALVYDAIRQADAEKAEREREIAAAKVAADEAREDKRWKKIQRYMIFGAAFGLLTPYILEIVRALT